MQVHSLEFEDFYEDNYTLIAIHTPLEDFKLAYLLNRNLNTHFSLASFKLDVERRENNASFPIYNYANEKYDNDWYLIANCFKEEQTNENDTLAFPTEMMTYLVPEEKRVDYFIKIVGEQDKQLIKKTLDRIKTINQIAASYTININTLKSKEFLIF